VTAKPPPQELKQFRTYLSMANMRAQYLTVCASVTLPEYGDDATVNPPDDKQSAGYQASPKMAESARAGRLARKWLPGSI